MMLAAPFTHFPTSHLPRLLIFLQYLVKMKLLNTHLFLRDRSHAFSSTKMVVLLRQLCVTIGKHT